MPIKPETQAIYKIHSFISKEVYHQKMSNPLLAGVPDVWYSGNKADLWVEYKRTDLVTHKAVIPSKLSKLQQNWLSKRKAEGRNVACIHVITIEATPEKKKEEFCIIDTERFGELIKVEYSRSIQQVADWINSTCFELTF